MKTSTHLADGLSIFCHQMRFKQKHKLKDIADIIEKDHSTVSYHLKMYDKKSRKLEFKEIEKDFRLEDFKEEYTEYRERKSGRQKEKLTVSNFNSGIKKSKE